MLPSMKVNVQLVKRRQAAFAGLDHNESVDDGYLYDMQNLSGDMIPVLSVRKGRTLERTISDFHGFGSADGKLYWVSGTSFYYDAAWKGSVAASDKRFGRLGNRIGPDGLLPGRRRSVVGHRNAERCQSNGCTAHPGRHFSLYGPAV